ncbi:hypothetical protein [Frankia sp. ArI3]
MGVTGGTGMPRRSSSGLVAAVVSSAITTSAVKVVRSSTPMSRPI